MLFNKIIYISIIAFKFKILIIQYLQIIQLSVP